MDLAFTPVPLRARADGWTPARQRAFIAALAAARCVVAACRAVGMTRRAAYLLRERAGADSFRAAWQAALTRATLPVGRAIAGIATAITYRGRRIGERRRFDNRLAITLLRRRCPERYGRRLDQTPSGWDEIMAATLDGDRPERSPSPAAPYREPCILSPVAARAASPDRDDALVRARERVRPSRPLAAWLRPTTRSAGQLY